MRNINGQNANHIKPYIAPEKPSHAQAITTPMAPTITDDKFTIANALTSRRPFSIPSRKELHPMRICANARTRISKAYCDVLNRKFEMESLWLKSTPAISADETQLKKLATCK